MAAGPVPSLKIAVALVEALGKRSQGVVDEAAKLFAGPAERTVFEPGTVGGGPAVD